MVQKGMDGGRQGGREGGKEAGRQEERDGGKQAVRQEGRKASRDKERMMLRIKRWQRRRGRRGNGRHMGVWEEEITAKE